MQGSRDNEGMEAGVPGSGRAPVVKVMSTQWQCCGGILAKKRFRLFLRDNMKEKNEHYFSQM